MGNEDEHVDEHPGDANDSERVQIVSIVLLVNTIRDDDSLPCGV